MFRFVFGFSHAKTAYELLPKEQKVSLLGIIDREPDVREGSVKLTVLLENFKDTRILVSTSRYSEYHYGDKLFLQGTLETPSDFETDTGRTFSYRFYLAKDFIYMTMKNPSVKILSHNNGSFLKRKLFVFKEILIAHISKVLNEPESTFLGGLILGQKRALGESLYNDLITTGTIHIVALSGYNVTIVATAIMTIFSFCFYFLPQLYGFILGSFGIFLFAIMTGGTTTVVRASIMAVIALLGKYVGRPYSIDRILVLTLVCMVFQNPWILVYDPSFQLSFLSTIGVVYFSPRLITKFYFITERFGLREVVVLTVSSYLFVLPFILYMNGIFSLVALPTNFLILPFIPLTMLTGTLALVFSFFSFYIALPLSFASYFLLHYELFIVHSFAKLQFASIHVPAFPFGVMFFVYAFLCWYIWRPFLKS